MYIQRCLVVTWLVPHETAAVLVHSVYTIQPCIMSCHFMQSYTCRVLWHACLAVTGHLHFWQNDQDLLCATAVEQIPIRWWNRYQMCEEYDDGHRQGDGVILWIDKMWRDTWCWWCIYWSHQRGNEVLTWGLVSFGWWWLNPWCLYDIWFGVSRPCTCPGLSLHCLMMT